MSVQALRFAAVGAAGFVVDSGVLYAALKLGLGPWTGRLLSFLSAAFFTWQLNRRFTFTAIASHGTQGLWDEWLRYLTAMTGGGLINMGIYALVVAVAKPHAGVPLAAVAFGSLGGLVFNYASARWWVYRTPQTHTPATPPAWWLSPGAYQALLLALVQLVFWSSHLRIAELPGLYMDAVNPDYLAAQLMQRQQVNPSFAMPSVLGPILGGLYHGVFNLYVGLPVFGVLGLNLLALRISHGLVGAAILLLTQLLLQRLSGSRAIATLGAMALASELAFVASWRTQNYIVLSGCVWLLASLWLALRQKPQRHHLLLSGLCMGLAVYCYFVFLFFVPAWLFWAWRQLRSWRLTGWWLAGFVLGMQTYALGYLSLLISLGGVTPTLNWLQQMLGALSPMGSQIEGGQVFLYLWQSARFAAANWGNELLMLGDTVSGDWVHLKFGVFMASLAALALQPLRRPAASLEVDVNSRLSSALPAWLLLSFWMCAMVFGTRLQPHHYASWLPLLYLLTALGATALWRVLPSAWRWAPVAVLAIMSVVNLQQQAPFFERLAATGGTGKFTNALNRLAEDSMHLPPMVVHVFPDWGFMMPFNFLTGNQRPYVIDLSTVTLTKMKAQGSPLRVAYWQESDGAQHRQRLEAAGYEITAVAPYLRRDQMPAFWLMEARLP